MMDTEASARGSLTSSLNFLSKTVPEMKQLENILICPICYEVMTNPTSTPCLHVFCSICLRKYLQFKQECPCCHAELHEQSLRLDKTAENLVGILPGLLKRLSGDRTVLKEKENVSPNKIMSSRSVLQPEAGCSSERSSCPVCSVNIPRANLTKHVETCLQNKQNPQTVKKPRPNPLPKLVYSLLKDKDLRSKCKEHGLNAKGEKSLLIARLKKYRLLYNDNIISENPKSPLELSMQVEREEKEEKSARVARPEILQYDRNTSQLEIEQKQKTYLKHNKDCFASLKQKINKETVEKRSSDSMKTNLNIAETVEYLEDISNREEEPAGSVSGDLFPKQETQSEIEKSGENPPINKLKRKSSPLNEKGKSAPNKKAKSGKPKTSKTSIKTPKKTPVKNIFEKLTQSAEQNRKTPRLNCPVCEISVPEKFLNIHLDKCLESSEKGNVKNQKRIAAASQKTRTKDAKKTVRKDPFSSDDSEEFEDVPSSVDEERIKKSFFLSNYRPEAREKRSRTVVKPPIVEDSQPDDNSQQDFSSDNLTKKQDKEEKSNADDNLDDTVSPPSSPLLGQYTETLSQGIDHVVEDKEKLVLTRISSRDMFESENESDSEEEIDTHEVSSNMLDMEEHIEEMMENALKEKEKEGSEASSQNSSSSSRSGRVSKRISMSIIPKKKTESSQEPVRRSSRRKV